MITITSIKTVLHDIAFYHVEAALHVLAFVIFKILKVCWALTSPDATLGDLKEYLKENIKTAIGPMTPIILCTLGQILYSILDRTAHDFTSNTLPLAAPFILPIILLDYSIKHFFEDIDGSVAPEFQTHEVQDPEVQLPGVPQPEVQPNSPCENCHSTMVTDSDDSDELNSLSRQQLHEEISTLRQQLSHVRENKSRLHRSYVRNGDELLKTRAEAKCNEKLLVRALNCYVALETNFGLQKEIILRLEDQLKILKLRAEMPEADESNGEDGDWGGNRTAV